MGSKLKNSKEINNTQFKNILKDLAKKENGNVALWLTLITAIFVIFVNFVFKERLAVGILLIFATDLLYKKNVKLFLSNTVANTMIFTIRYILLFNAILLAIIKFIK